MDLKTLTKEELLSAAVSELKSRGVVISPTRDKQEALEHLTDDELKTIVANRGDIGNIAAVAAEAPKE